MTLEEKSLIINLIKDLKVTSINQVWTTDITYIKTINEGTFYFFTTLLHIKFIAEFLFFLKSFFPRYI